MSGVVTGHGTYWPRVGSVTSPLGMLVVGEGPVMGMVVGSHYQSVRRLVYGVMGVSCICCLAARVSIVKKFVRLEL